MGQLYVNKAGEENKYFKVLRKKPSSAVPRGEIPELSSAFSKGTEWVSLGLKMGLRRVYLVT